MSIAGFKKQVNKANQVTYPIRLSPASIERPKAYIAALIHYMF